MASLYVFGNFLERLVAPLFGISKDNQMTSHSKGAPVRERHDYAAAEISRNRAQDLASSPSNRDDPARMASAQPPSPSPHDNRNDKVANDIKGSSSLGRDGGQEARTLAHCTEVNKQERVEVVNSISYPNRFRQRNLGVTEISQQPSLEERLNVAIVAAFDAEQQLENSRSECEVLQKKVKELSGLLQDSQDFIFRIQPYQQNITETVATLEYNALFESVQSWVEFRLGDDIYDRSMLKESSFLPRRASEFLKLVSPAGRECFSYPETDQPNVVAAVMQFLIEEIFELDFYCPIETGAMEFLNTIEQSMRTLVPHRDIATTRSWRSETLNAIINRSSFSDCRAEHVKNLTTSLAKMLRIFKPQAQMKEFQSSIRALIIKPAIELAEKLQLSVNNFEISWTPHSEGLAGNRADTRPDLQQYECINTQGKTIRSPVDQETPGRENVVYLLDICPGLSCRNVKSDAWSDAKVLKKPKVLVAVMRPDEHLGQQGSSSDADVTLLGTLDRRLNTKRGWIK